MKKIIVVLLLCAISTNTKAQFDFHLEDTNGYLIPQLAMVAGFVTALPPSYYDTQRIGNNFPIQAEGTKIYGVAVLLQDSICSDSGYYVFLYRDNDGCAAVDSIRVDTVTSIANRMYLQYIKYNPYQIRDTMLPIYEVYFDKGYYIDSSRFSVAFGHKKIDTSLITTHYYRYATINRTGMCKSFKVTERVSCEKGAPSFFPGAFPIIDSTVRIRHERILACGGIGAPKADYTAVRTFSLHWSDTNGHCLYQVAYGRANQPLSEYTVVETTDTCFTLAGLNYGDPWAFRVRAQCCFDDSMSVWRPWSDTVRFARPYYSLILLANNPYWGTMSESGPHECGDTLMIAAFPAANCTFERWNDGDTANPRTITLVCDTMFTAFFEYHPDTSGGDTTAIMTCRDDGVTLAPNPTDGIVHITAEGALIDAAVYDLRGRKVKECKGSGDTMELDLKGLPSGVYTVTIHTARGTAVRKLALR
jgi:hypothetical protein